VYEFNKYLAEHFRDEEEFMESIDYPDAQVHKELHEKIIKRGTDVLKNASSVAQMKSEMKKVSKDFFIEHILKHDMKIKYFYDKPENENIQEISGIS
jgi:hemerythrin